jgi:hypothetical protein
MGIKIYSRITLSYEYSEGSDVPNLSKSYMLTHKIVAFYTQAIRIVQIFKRFVPTISFSRPL